MPELELHDAEVTEAENGQCKAVETENGDHLNVDCQNLLPYIQVGDRVIVTRLSTGQLKVMGVDKPNECSLLAAIGTRAMRLHATEDTTGVSIQKSDCSISIINGVVSLDGEVHYG